MITRRLFAAGVLGAGALAVAAPPSLAEDKIKAVATFSILADFVREVGGARVDLVALVGADGDAHVYSPTPADARRLSEARIVFANGLGFEGWIARLIKSSGTKAVVVEAAKGVATIRAGAKPGHGHGHGHDHAGEVDPHAWQSVPNAKIYVANIRDALAAADPAGRDAYAANAAAYLQKLDALEAELRAAVAKIPPERRRLITGHDAFGYFARTYGIAMVAPQGVSTETEASAADVAKIVRQIKREKIGAVFLENISDPRLIERIAKESGAVVGGRLYSDALSGPDGPASTYIAMMRHNMNAFSAALTS